MKCSLLVPFSLICLLIWAGCSSTTDIVKKEEGVSVEGIVEKYEPSASVMYSYDFCAQLAETRLSHVRVVRPAALAGKILAVDLGLTPGKSEVESSAFTISGATVKFVLPRSLANAKPETLIDLYSLRKEPNRVAGSD